MKTSSITDYFSTILNKNKPGHKKVCSFLGAIFLMLSYGGINLWGTFNIYFCSYYYEKDQLLPKDTSLVISFVALPIAFLFLFSIQLSEKFGFKRIISAALLFPICIILSAFVGFNIYIFLALYFMIPVLIFALTLNPIFYCVWSYSPEIKGKVSGYLFGILQLSMIFYIMVGTYIMNPENLTPSLKINESFLYEKEVTNNMQKTLIFFGFTSLLCGMLGFYFIQNPFNETEIEKNLINDKDCRKIEEKIKAEEFLEGENICDPSKKKKVKNELLMDSYFQTEKLVDRFEMLNKSKEESLNECPDLKTGLKSSPFIILFINSFLITLFPLFLSINFKDYTMKILNDDFLATWLYIINLIVGGFGRFFWGYLVDKFPFKNIIITLNILAIITGLTLPFMINQTSFAIFYLSCSFFDGGVMSVIGPGLLHIFGLNIGVKLLGAKGISFVLSLMLIPILSLFLRKCLSLENILLILGAVNAIGLILCLFLKKSYKWKNDSLNERMAIN